MTLIFFGGAVIAWICLAVPNAFALQLVLRKIRGEAPHYWNAFFTTAISGVAVQFAGLVLSLALGSAASLLASFILPAFLYSKLLRLPSGSEVSLGQTLAIICAQLTLTIALLISLFYISVLLFYWEPIDIVLLRWYNQIINFIVGNSGTISHASSDRAELVTSGEASIGTFLADYGSYLAFLLVFLVLFFAFNPYRKSREGSLKQTSQATTSGKDSAASDELKDSLGIDGVSTAKIPDPVKLSENAMKTEENTRAKVAPGMLQGPSGAIRISGFAIILSCLFPPWCIQTQVRTVHVGYSFFLNPPGPSTTVNTSLLLVQVCAIFLCGIAFWLAGRK
jgi:hypothetical protein